MPSGQEGFGIVFLEAMYFGAPVIAAGEKGASDVIQNGDTGVLVPYGDIVSLRVAIDSVLRDGGLRQLLRSRGREAVTENGPFTFRAFTERWRQLVAG